MSHLEKACIVLGLTTDWKAKAVITWGRGFAKAGDGFSSPRPAITKEQQAQKAMAHGWRALFTILALLSYSFLLRAPSECGPLTGRRTGEDPISEERLERRAAIGSADRKLIIRLNRRKHMSAGSRIVSVRTCGDYTPESLELRAPRLFCPVCRL